MDISVTTAATVFPVTLAQAKAHLQVEHADDDSYINLLLRVATDLLERYTARSFLTQTIQVDLDANEAASPFFLPRPPYVASSISTFNTYDEDGDATAVTTSDYYVSGLNPARIAAKSAGWPILRDYTALRIVYQGGYGANATKVPEALRHAVLIVIKWLWENPDGAVADGLFDLPPQAKILCAPYRTTF